MATTVRITETYDMKTTVGKMGVIGIHTPDFSLVQKLYPGLIKNHRFIRYKKCDVVGACASVLPADPLQVGVTAGAVAPEDMFNPILYKAVTNESFDVLMARIYDMADLATGSICAGNLADSGAMSSEANQFKLYYSLLSAKNGFRKAMPQAGFKVNGLVPICHTLVSSYGNVTKPKNYSVAKANTEDEIVGVPNTADFPDLTGADSISYDYQNGTMGNAPLTFRGRTVKMPRLPLHTQAEQASSTPTPAEVKTYVMALVTPPAKLHEFYYRMRVSWTLSFESVVPITEFGLVPMKNAGESAHAQNYTIDSSKSELEHNANMSDADGVDISKIMES